MTDAREGRVPEGYTHPSEQEWEKITSQAEMAVTKLCLQMLDQMRDMKMNTALAPGLALGALGAAAKIARAVSNPDYMHVMEQHALAVVRGVIRDADYPVHDNGKPFERSCDA